MTTNDTYETLYARYRKAAGMTQEYAAELLGVATRTLQAWERGESTPPNIRVLAMCDIYTAPTLAIEHLRMTNIIAYDTLPAVRAVPVARSARCSRRSGSWRRSTPGTGCWTSPRTGRSTRSSAPTMTSC